ncbi:dihydroxyacetone kinase subunit DhaK [Vibrio algarum]|uniref:Dihydroxyacetone kinase subunit DhaK n=1 Tax=Vibrio algarum TaxID=3020714 RepID=A0ABT4YVC5_9VIBR|nr:dihydroxyacetone kinase subunit DhaK [Vibrio sp. KJ40-1]MDB1125506.1 dihydroxyacetone kinase subunit DhaK [Vibrio sp. KJ40-1]
MRVPKKLLNDPQNVAVEQFEGFIAATNKDLQQVGSLTAAVRKNFNSSKVAVVTGGGAGHEPMYGGYVGQGLADAVATGDVFAAPTPDVIYETTMALEPSNGVLFVYGNYAGDNMNFDIAAELLEDEDIPSHTIRINDDVISASDENRVERRGIAGALFVLKAAGAASELHDNFDDVVKATEKALQHTASVGVALGPCAIPRNNTFNFEIADDEIEIGMGLHGEPGVGKTKISNADETVYELMDRLNEELELQSGNEVCVLVNNLGASTQMELLIANRAVNQYLAEKNITVHDCLVGGYCTSLEMSGYSISLFKLDAELKKLYDTPCNSFALRK